MTVHVRRGDAVGANSHVFVAPKSNRRLGGLYAHALTKTQVEESTSVENVHSVLVDALTKARLIGTASSNAEKNNVTVVIFSNERSPHFFDSLRQDFNIVTEPELLRLVLYDKTDFHYDKLQSRSPLSSSIFAMALNEYVVKYDSLTICTAASKMNEPCDYFLVSGVAT